MGGHCQRCGVVSVFRSVLKFDGCVKVYLSNFEMSCFGSAAINVAKERYLQHKPEWTDSQKIIVQNTWAVILKTSGLAKFGDDIFVDYFKVDPEAKDLFFFMRSRDKPYESDDYKDHVKIFAKHLGMFIDVCEDDAKFEKMNRQLGRLHDSLFSIRITYSDNDALIHSKLNYHFEKSERSVAVAVKNAVGDAFNDEIDDAWMAFYRLCLYYIMDEIDICVNPPTVTRTTLLKC